MESSVGINGSIQHLSKNSSDQLLRKFAEVGSDSGAGRRLLAVVVKRRGSRTTRRAVNEQLCESPVGGGGGVADRKWLIPPAGRKSAVLKKIGIGNGKSKPQQQLRIRDFRNKSILGAFQKTWRRASKVLLEKHYNTHRRLISDIV